VLDKACCKPAIGHLLFAEQAREGAAVVDNGRWLDQPDTAQLRLCESHVDLGFEVAKTADRIVDSACLGWKSYQSLIGTSDRGTPGQSHYPFDGLARAMARAVSP